MATGIVVPQQPPVVVDPGFSWSGAYVGVMASTTSLDAEDFSFGPGPFDMDGGTAGIFAGYNFMFGDVMVGIEGSYSSGGIDGDDAAFMDPVEIENTAQLRARLGYAIDRILPYVAVGVISSDVFSNHSGFGAATQTYTGFSYGIGVDYALRDNIFVRAEIEHLNYDRDDFDFSGGDLHDFDMDGTRLSIGVAYRF